MVAVKAHYDSLLGSVYSWIVGDFESACRSSAALFDELDIRPAGTGLALDLGAGPGSQSVPLAERGFRVVAIDFCDALLEELKDRAGNLDIRTTSADICRFREHIDDDPELIVCMGDTLVHLPDRNTADALLADCAKALAPGGSIVVSIRDYDAPGPSGADRFIPIRSTEDRIFTCFLDYGDDYVDVHDMLQEQVDGEWRLSVSGYRKLRLGMDHVEATLAAAGLDVVRPAGYADMLVLHATKGR